MRTTHADGTHISDTSRVRRVGAALAALLCVSAAAPEPDEPPVDMVISARRIEERALARRLFPPESERRDGNAAVVMLLAASDRNPVAWRNLIEHAPRYLAMPADEFAVERAQSDVPLWFAEELRRAAYTRSVDWDLPLDNIRYFDFHRVRIPHIGDGRSMLTGLAVHCRADIAQGRTDAALDKMTTAFGLIGHLQDGPFLLVKYIEAQQMGLWLERVEELVATEHAPNLYWALTTFPRRLIDLRPAADYITRAEVMEAPSFRHVTPTRARAMWADIRNSLDLFRIPGPSESVTRDVAAIREEFAGFVARAREELPVGDPSLAEPIKSMSDDEVAVRYLIARHAVGAEEVARALVLPPPEGLALLQRANERIEREEHPQIAKYVPSALEEYVLVWAMRRRLDALRVIEAIRDYAAQHNGRLPDRLTDIEGLPLPEDVFSAQPFEYGREGDVAFLSAKPVALWHGEKYRINYRIRIR